MMVKRYPILKEEVGGSIPDCKISSLLWHKLAKWSTTFYALTRACQPSISKWNKNNRNDKSTTLVIIVMVIGCFTCEALALAVFTCVCKFIGSNWVSVKKSMWVGDHYESLVHIITKVTKMKSHFVFEKFSCRCTFYEIYFKYTQFHQNLFTGAVYFCKTPWYHL